MRVLVRAAQLIMLALAPSWSSPDPQPPASPAITVLLAVLALTAGLICAYRLYARVRNPASLAAALLACAALAAALAGAVAFSGVHGPLGRGVMYVAVPAWAALALTATAIAQRRFGDAARGRRLAAAILVLAIGAALHIDAAPVFSSRETMWWEVFRRDGDDRRPIAALAAPLLHARRFADAARVADRCALVHPTSCACPMLRANMEISTRELDAAPPAPR
jgi:hypothetical protein